MTLNPFEKKAYQLGFDFTNPYVQQNNPWYSYFIGPQASFKRATALAKETVGYDANAAARNAFGAQLTGDAKAVWDTMSDAEKDAFMAPGWTEEEKNFSNLWGLFGTARTFDEAETNRLIQEALLLEAKPVYDVDLDQIQANASKAIEDENEKLLESLNADLKSMGDAYTNSRNALLTQQHQRNAQTIDAMASDMARARRNAIEAGASAGVRIAGNVNALLSAQNKMSQQSLETSNQLAQMLVNQRNAEAGLRNQWRDIQSSTYERTQNRAANDLNFANAKYDQKVRNWQDKNDALVSETNPYRDQFQKYKNKTAYSNSGSSAYGG